MRLHGSEILRAFFIIDILPKEEGGELMKRAVVIAAACAGVLAACGFCIKVRRGG